MRTLRQIHVVSQRVAPWSGHVLACVIAGAFVSLQMLAQGASLAG